jgi:hypothetical protein
MCCLESSAPRAVRATEVLACSNLEPDFRSLRLIPSNLHPIYQWPHLLAGKCPTKWTGLALKRETLPSILSTGTPFPGKTAPHHASFTDVLSIGGKKERFAFTRKARKCLISSSKVSISANDQIPCRRFVRRSWRSERALFRRDRQRFRQKRTPD